MIAALHSLLSARTPLAIGNAELWLRALPAECLEKQEPVDRALACGQLAATPQLAAIGAHQAALRWIDPTLPTFAIGAFCATEPQGAHPRVLRTSLRKLPPVIGPPTDPQTAAATRTRAWGLDGLKQWATLSPVADVLFVVASTGWIEERNQLSLVRIPADRKGVSISTMGSEPNPDVPHGEVRFEGVRVKGHEILPLDGYVDAMKPMRVLEDLFCAAASLAGWLNLGLRMNWPRPELEATAALVVALRGLGLQDPRDYALHVGLAGALHLTAERTEALKRLASGTLEPEDAAWIENSKSAPVASRAQESRRRTAWRELRITGRRTRP